MFHLVKTRSCFGYLLPCEPKHSWINSEFIYTVQCFCLYWIHTLRDSFKSYIKINLDGKVIFMSCLRLLGLLWLNVLRLDEPSLNLKSFAPSKWFFAHGCELWAVCLSPLKKQHPKSMIKSTLLFVWTFTSKAIQHPRHGDSQICIHFYHITANSVSKL